MKNKIIILEGLDYNCNYSYAPPVKSILLNIDDISTVTEVQTRRQEKCSLIRMKNNGGQCTVIGSPEEINEQILKQYED